MPSACPPACYADTGAGSVATPIALSVRRSYRSLQARAVARYAGTVNEPPSLGEIIHQQRELTELSMRQFAAMVGISNPYLSQIERGLREPSERVVDAIARSLETSADALYEQAGLIAATDDHDDGDAVPTAIQTDPALTPRQRRVLLDVYDAFIACAPAPASGARKRRPRREASSRER
jgi:transcriptional regulator with XRE-family HTH domain